MKSESMQLPPGNFLERSKYLCVVGIAPSQAAYHIFDVVVTAALHGQMHSRAGQLS